MKERPQVDLNELVKAIDKKRKRRKSAKECIRARKRVNEKRRNGKNEVGLGFNCLGSKASVLNNSSIDFLIGVKLFLLLT